MIPVFPTTYFGSIAYFSELAKYEKVIIEGHEHFPKQTYRNRCDILGANGILSLSIPVKRENGSHTPTSRILTSSTENWRMRHWRSIMSGYESAPFFDYYGMEIQEILFNEEESLLSYNQTILERMLSWLDLEIELQRSDFFAPPLEDDYRRSVIEKNHGQAIETAPYIQVFPGENNFRKSLSILDAILCLGPLARNLII